MENTTEKTPLQILLDKESEIRKTFEKAVRYISERKEFVEHNVEDIVSAARVIIDCRAALADINKQKLFVTFTAAK